MTGMTPPRLPVPTPPSQSWRERTPTRAEWIALTAVSVLPIVGGILKVANPGWVLIGAIMWSPVIALVYFAGIVVFRLSLGRRSELRLARGSVPRRYRVLAWTWAVAFFLPGFVLVGGDDSFPLHSALLTLIRLEQPEWYWGFEDVVMIAVAIGLLGGTVAAWVCYLRDVRLARRAWSSTTLP